MTAKPNENRTGKLENDKDYVLAFRRLVDDFNRLVRAFNSDTGESISFSEITETPDDLEGYGILNAAHLHHRHDASEIDDLPSGGGAPGDKGDKGDKGDIGDRGPQGWSIPGLDAPPNIEPLMIPGLRGLKGDRGSFGVGVPGMDGQQGPEPMMIPGRSGPAGNAGGPGKMGQIIPPELPLPPLEPMMIQGRSGNPGTAGVAGRTVMIPGLDGRDGPEPMLIPGKAGADGSGFFSAGEWNAVDTYFPLDVVGYQGTLWWTKFGHPPGDTPGVTADWIEMLKMPAPRPGPPSMEVARPLEPMMITGPRGATGGAGGGGLTMTTVELDIGAAPRLRRSGKLQITGLAGLTAGKPVLVQQAVGPYTGKGTRADEAEMDLLKATGKVLNAATIDVYWESQRKVRGKFKFDYAVSA